MSAEICAADTPITAGPSPGARGAHPGRASRSAAGQHPDLGQRSNLQRELRNAADEHAPRQRLDRRIAIRRQKERRADDRYVEQDRRERGNRELPVDVEHAPGERYQRDEKR
jgi:hypothetical protein